MIYLGNGQGRHPNNLEDPDILESVFQPNLTSAQYTLAGDARGEVCIPIITEDAWNFVVFLSGMMLN